MSLDQDNFPLRVTPGPGKTLDAQSIRVALGKLCMGITPYESGWFAVLVPRTDEKIQKAVARLHDLGYVTDWPE